MDVTAPPQAPAAYHGKGWQPRAGTLRTDLRAGHGWRPAGYDSEWAALRTVMLACPPDWPAPADWNAVQYLGPVDFPALRRELTGFARTLRGLGVDVRLRELPLSAGYNGFFVRDQFFMTPEGAIVGRMGSAPRGGEEPATTRALAAEGVPILRTIGGAGCFEGADALWLRPDLVAIGIGNRTNEAGAAQVRDVLAGLGVRTRTFVLPSSVQHLLGLCQLVGPDLAAIRTEVAPAGLVALLDACGIRVLEFAEHPEIVRGQAMNFVTVAERAVVMVGGAPRTRAQLIQAGITVRATVHCPELLNAAGGLACATGVLHRSILEEPR